MAYDSLKRPIFSLTCAAILVACGGSSETGASGEGLDGGCADPSLCTGAGGSGVTGAGSASSTGSGSTTGTGNMTGSGNTPSYGGITGSGGFPGTGNVPTGTGNAPAGTGGAPVSLTCGNGTLEAGEDCEPSLALDPTVTCATVTMNALPRGFLQCGSNCFYDTSRCRSANGGTGTGGAGTGGAGTGAGGGP